LPETIAQLHDLPDAVVSVDSPSELRWLAEQGVANPLVLRLRPDFGSEAVVAAGKESRFGFTADDLVRTREMVASLRLNVVGFHVFAGSQVLHAEGVISHLRASLELSLCAADVLDIEPLMVNLGGGFGIPYGRDDPQLDLEPIGRDLQRLLDRASPARIVLELGRFLVAEAGWYLTTVVGSQTNQGRLAVIVDGGTHQRADMCGLCLRTRAQSPIVLSGARGEPAPTDVLGCLSLPADVLAEASPLPVLDPGTVLAFQNAGAYGLWSSPALFHGSPLPAEVAFDGERICLMRERQSIQSIVDQQQHVVRVGFSRDSQRSAEERGNEETSGRVAVQ
jgi:diaminopimelate decarboxylase